MLNAQALASHRLPQALPIAESAPPSVARVAPAQVSFRGTSHALSFRVRAAAPESGAAAKPGLDIDNMSVRQLRALSTVAAGIHDIVNGRPARYPVVGVMGGMGPAASVQFGQLLVSENHGAKKDQDHVRAVIHQATDIPDRTGAILSGGRDPVPEMVKSLRTLERAGAEHVVMTCNTAHYFADHLEAEIRQSMPHMKLHHIVDATMEELDRMAPGARNVGLLATSGTVQTGVYQNRAKARTWMTPDDDTQRKVMSGIYDGVKAGDLALGRALLLEAAQKLADEGAEAILLACTEIPLVLKHGDIKNKEGKDVPLIDTLASLAHKAIEVAGKPEPAVPGLFERVAGVLHAAYDEIAARA